MSRAIDIVQVKSEIQSGKLAVKFKDNDVLLIDKQSGEAVCIAPLTPPNELLTPYPDGDTSIIACPRCGSGEYLHNEDGNEQNYCGQCGQAIDWSRPPEGERDA